MIKKLMALMALLMTSVAPALASEADLIVPSIKTLSPSSYTLLLIGLGISVVGLIFGLWKFLEVKKLEVHSVMASVGNTIFETCKTQNISYSAGQIFTSP